MFLIHCKYMFTSLTNSLCIYLKYVHPCEKSMFRRMPNYSQPPGTGIPPTWSKSNNFQMERENAVTIFYF